MIEKINYLLEFFSVKQHARHAILRYYISTEIDNQLNGHFEIKNSKFFIIYFNENSSKIRIT